MKKICCRLLNRLPVRCIVRTGSMRSDTCAQTHLGISLRRGTGVKVIGEYAFCGCSSVSSLTLAEGLEKIWACAFAYCHLATLSVPETVTEIGAMAFYFNIYLKRTKLPNNLTEISAGFFSECRELIHCSLPQNLTKIGDGAFSSCHSLVELTIPKTVTYIGRGAFWICLGLQRVTFADPDGWWVCQKQNITGESDPAAKLLTNCNDAYAIAIAMAEPYQDYYWHKG